MRVIVGVVACAVVLAVTSLAAASAASAATFSTPVQLVGTNSSGAPDPTAGPFGGEPSIATDPLGHVYVESPRRHPERGSTVTAGTGFWVSSNGGSELRQAARFIGSYLGGGDDDVIFAGTPRANSVFIDDLEAIAATEVCMSTDFGKTFDRGRPGSQTPDNCSDDQRIGQVGPLGRPAVADGYDARR